MSADKTLNLLGSTSGALSTTILGNGGPAPSLSAVTFFVSFNSGATICHGVPHRPSQFVRGVNSDKGPDSSVSGVPVVSCLDQVSVQVEVEREEQGFGEIYTERKKERNRESNDHEHEVMRSCRHLSQCGVSHIMKHVRCV